MGEYPLFPGNDRGFVSAERAYVSIPGKAVSIEGERAALNLPYVKNVFLRTAPGDRTRFPRNNVEKCGNVITQAPERQTAVRYASKALRSMLVRLEPGEKETLSFLKGDSEGWAPAAFTLQSEKNRTALEQMPFYVHTDDAEGPVIFLPEPDEESGSDWHGVSFREALDAVFRFAYPADIVPGRIFWDAFLKGSVQAGVWLIETLNFYGESGKKVDNFIREWYGS